MAHASLFFLPHSLTSPITGKQAHNVHLFYILINIEYFLVTDIRMTYEFLNVEESSQCF